MHLSTFSLAGAVGLCLSSQALAAGLTIADIAPSDSIFVVGVDDMTTAKAAFDRTGFKAIWEDRALHAWAIDAMGDSMDEAREQLDELGVDMDKLMVAPQGAMGFAMWTGENDMGEYVLFADYGDNADDLNDQFVEIFVNAVEKDMFKLDETDFGDTTIYSIEYAEGDEEADDEDEWDEGDEWDNEWEDESDPPFDMDEMHYARMGGHLVISSDMDRLERTLEMFEAGEAENGIGESDNFQEAMSGIGAVNAYAFVNLAAAIEEIGADMFPGMNAMLGLDTLRSLAAGVRFDTDDAMLESRFSIITPEKKGVLALLDNPPIAIAPPAFVGADTASATGMQFKFSQLIPTVERIINSMPPEESGQMIMMFEGIKQMAGPLFANIGPEIYITQSITKPFGAESQTGFVAIKSGDAASVNQAIQSIAPMVGLASRDFLGNTIWSAPAGGFVQIPTIGVGGGHIFIGPETAIENALRANEGGLADEQGFQDAVAPLGGKIGRAHV